MMVYIVELGYKSFRFESACEAMQFAQMARASFINSRYDNGDLDVEIKLVFEIDEDVNSAESVENKEEN